MQQLTNEEIARVFAMYMPCQIISKDHKETWDLIGVRVNGTIDIEDSLYKHDAIDFHLSLTPLSKISDEHCLDIAKMMYWTGSFYNIDEATQIKWARESITPTLRKPESDRMSSYDFYHFFISKGYAVPLWFGVGHECNGKTAIELGIAIEKQAA